MRNLEGRLGARLFERRDNRLHLTSIGRVALEEAEQMEATARAFARKVAGTSQEIAGDVRINVSEGLATYWLLPRMQPFQQFHPELTINWYVTNSRLHDVATEVDIALWWQRPTDPSFVGRLLGKVRYSLFAPRSYVQRYRWPSSVEDLSQHHLLHFNGYEINPGLRVWNDLMHRFSPVSRLENPAATEAVLEAGTLMTLLPDYSSICLPRLKRGPLDLGISLELWLVYHEDRRAVPRIRAAAAEIARLARADRGVWFM